MGELRDILISVKEEHVKNILSGNKTLELRRRAVRIPSECRVWIYSKVPRGRVEALCIVDSVFEASPSRIWAQHSKRCGISRDEFSTYFSGVKTGYAILFKEVHHLDPILSLEEIRKRLSSFQPPQFFKRLAADSPELVLFQSAFVS